MTEQGKKTMTYSCVDCHVQNCDNKEAERGSYPKYCVTPQMTEQEREKLQQIYGEEENQRIMKAAAQVESEGYRMWTRVQEIVEFAKKLGAKKIGIATCVGLINESRIFAEILRKHGFEVYSIACKAGAIEKVSVGIPKECESAGVVMCNPIFQAQILNEEETDLNVVMGLCVGHDSLFYRYAKAPVTTLITKDRVLGHNPAAALYTAKTYYADL